jgi:hypothetical protein
MSESETSSEIKVNYLNSQGDNLIEDKSNGVKQTTDTDYYFNMIANPSKVTQSKFNATSESSELNDLLKNTDSASSKISSKSNTSNKKELKTISSDSDNKKSSESREKYEKISISPNKNTTNVFQKNYQEDKIKKQERKSVSPVIIKNNTQTISEIKPIEKKELTPQELRLKKIEMLRKLCEIKLKGFTLSKEYDFNSSLEEMEYEFELLKSFADKRNGVKIFKGGLLQAVSVIEFLNDKYDPFDFHLSGWSDHMQLEVDSWEDVLEEIYEKYKGTGRQMAPEIKLLYLIIASAGAFHFTKSQSSKLPGLDSILASNPGLLSKIINPSKTESSQFMTQQEVNIERQRDEHRKKESESKIQIQKQMQQQQEYINQLQSQLNNQSRNNEPPRNFSINEPLNSNSGMTFINSNFNNEPQPANSKPPIDTNTFRPNIPDIRAPSNVKDILNRIHNLQPSTIKAGASDTQEESSSSNNDRIISETTLSEGNPKKRNKLRKTKKSALSVL